MWNQGRLDIKNAQPALREQAGWTFSPASGSWGVDYLSRAATARVGIGGKLAADGIDASARVDASGQKLQGAHSYVIEFAPPPPVNAFWSLTLLDAEGRMVDNVLNRYSLRGDRLRKQGGTAASTSRIARQTRIAAATGYPPRPARSSSCCASTNRSSLRSTAPGNPP